MTKEEALIKAKEHYWFLSEFPEWNSDKEVVSAAVEQNGLFLQYASDELRNDKEVVVIAVQKNGRALRFASDELRNDKEVILKAVRQNSATCQVSLLKDYQNFNEIVEKEGEEFLFSCWNNQYWKTRLRVTNHPNFLPTLEQLEIGLQNSSYEVQEVYQLRQDEWLAKLEENKLRNTL